MKSFKQMVSEVAKPISPDEQRFIDQHTYEVQQHPVALDHQFTGDIAGKTSGKAAEPDATKYDAAYAKKEPAVETIGEETEEVELSEDPSQEKPMMMGALRAMSHNMMGIAKYVQSTNDPEEWFQNKLAGVAKEMQTLYSYATAETMTGMATEETVVENKQASIMKKLAKASASSEKGKKAVTLKKAPWEKKEEAEQIDEISKKLAGRYINKANIDTADAADRTARGHEDGRSNDKDIKAQGKANVKKGINTFMKRNQGTKTAVDKLTGKARVPAKEELSDKQKKIDHNKNGKIDGHDLAMIRKKKNEEVELDEAQIDKMKFVSKGFSNRKAADRHNDQLVGSGKASQKSYVYKHKDNKFYVADMKEDLDETTTSALKRPVTQTGPDGKTRTVMKKTKADKTDDRGQDVMGTNESVALEEAMKFKPGAMRLKDGSQVVLKKEDAQALTAMFKDLSRQNQKKLGEVAQKDKSGFEEILGFAREAL